MILLSTSMSDTAEVISAHSTFADAIPTNLTDASTLELKRVAAVPAKDTRTRRAFSPAELQETIPHSVQTEVARRISSSKQVLLLAEWEGQVTEVHDDFIVAQLRGIFGEGVRDSIEMARIPTTDLRTEDMSLARAGAFFRMCSSYEIGSKRQRKRLMEITFRKTPVYKQDLLERARVVAGDLHSGLRLE